MKKFDLTDKRIWVTGHQSLLGAAVCKRLQARNCCKLLTSEDSPLDLCSQSETLEWVGEYRPDVIIHCAVKESGIGANHAYPVEFLTENLQLGLSVLNAAAKGGVSKLVSFGSSCFYPRSSEQPISEACLLQGALEPTNEAYALAKISIVKLTSYYRRQYNKDFIAVVPSNIYGPGDHFDPVDGHVIGSLIYKFCKARQENLPSVEIWGSGNPLREFIYVDDAADGVLFLSENYSGDRHINLSGGDTVSIKHLANLIAELTGYDGVIQFDTTRPDGMMKKSLDNTVIDSLGWHPNVSLRDGLRSTIVSYLE